MSTTQTLETDTSDEELLRRVRAGDRSAYSELWRLYSRAGLRAASSYRRLADPEDLVAEAYTTVLRAIDAGRGPQTHFKPYLYTTIRNLALREAAPVVVAG